MQLYHPPFLAGPKYIFSFPRAKDQKEGGTVLSNIPRTNMAGNAEVRSSVSLPLSLLLLGAPKKKGEKEIVGIVWIEYSAGIRELPSNIGWGVTVLL